MKRRPLGIFGAAGIDFWGPTVWVTLDQLSSTNIGGKESWTLTCELRHVDEIDAYERLVEADIKAAFSEARSKFRKLQAQPRKLAFKR